MLTPLQIRQHALALAESPAWTDFVLPEIQRHIVKYEEQLLSSTPLPDRDRADAHTRYHALKAVLRDLQGYVNDSLIQMSTEEATFTPHAIRLRLATVFSSSASPAAPAPLSPPAAPIPFPPLPSFNPFTSPPPEETPTSSGQPSSI